MNVWRSEPAVIIGSVVAAIEALFAMLVLLGALDLTGEQVVAIVAFAAALGAIAQAVLTRSQVTPVHAAAAAVDEARRGEPTEYDEI